MVYFRKVEFLSIKEELITNNSLQNQTIKNNFMFGAVMLDENNCRGFLERALDMPIGRIEIDKEKSIVYHPEYKGVRLDVYAKDDDNRRFNVEMQVLREPSPGKRSRYYHSQIDMDLLLKGMSYEHLPDSYVIFICNYDPFFAGKYRYVFRNICLESEQLHLQDGSWTIFLNTKGTNDDEIPKELLSFLQYVKASPEDSERDYDDPYVKQLQQSIASIKRDREMGRKYMLLEEFVQRQCQLVKAESKIETTIEILLFILRKLSDIPPSLSDHIMAQSDLQLLNNWLDHAVSVSSIEEFMEKIQFPNSI